ncbi:MAG: bifunctional metallophosphatase/5'-nucleotidase [Planctomycetes bacterium]|nr:bifunctional metallophosphatase/5'-nucleotidase [Planctomycetota bacterium]
MVATPRALRPLSLLVLAALPLLGGCPLPGAPSRGRGPRRSEEGARLVVVHTNDVHGQAYPVAVTDESGQRRERGGYAALARYIAREREAAERSGAGLLLLDGGDIWQGTPEGTLTGGRLCIEFMNLVGYDAAAPGNHEFDHGATRFVALAAHADFPFLSGNILNEATADTPVWLRRAVVREVNGVRVGLSGLTTSTTPTITMKGSTEGLAFDSEVTGARAAVAELRQAGAQVVILVSHCGEEDDRVVARSVPGIDLIVGGHSHTALVPEEVPGTGTLLVQAGSKGRWAGRVELSISLPSGRVVAHEARLDELEAVPLESVPDVAEVVARWSGEVQRRMESRVGELRVSLGRDPAPFSSPLGCFLADLMRERTGVQVAFHNNGGIRADLAAGPVTLRDLFQVSPFGNTLVTCTLEGSTLKKVLEHALAYPRGAMEVSGLVCRFDPTAPEGARVRRVEVGGEPLDEARSYRVVTNNFIFQGGDGHTAFAEATEVEETGVAFLDAQTDWFRDRGPVDYAFENRLIPVGP